MKRVGVVVHDGSGLGASRAMEGKARTQPGRAKQEGGREGSETHSEIGGGRFFVDRVLLW